FVTAAGTVFDSEGLRDYLRERLPEHMIPSACVELDALPLSAHGKLDRNRLPEPPPSTTLSKDSGSAPQTHAEEMLADIWAEVLKIEHIHRESSFFQLGGHSLLVMQVLSRVEKVWGIKMEVRALFENPRLDQLAARIEEGAGGKEQGRRRALVARGRREEMPLSFAQQRLWF